MSRMRQVSWWAAALLVVGLVGCDGTAEISDSGTSDAGASVDGGVDAGTDTARVPDTGGSSGETGVRDVFDAGPCPDGGDRTLPQSSSGRLVATPVSEADLAIDGRLDEANAAALEFGDAAGQSDNRATAHARWTDEALYLGMEVIDEQLETGASTGPWHNDSVEIAMDARGDGGRLSNDDRKWLGDVDGTTTISRGDDDHWVDPASEQADIAVETNDDGYVVEFRVPWSAIGGLESAKSAGGPGLILVVNDRDDGEVRRFSWTGPNELRTPSEWGVLALGQPSCGDGPVDAGDTGTDDADAGLDPDGDAGDGTEPRLGPPRYVHESDFNFQTTLNAVDDLGMDPTGQQPIDDQLDAARASNTLIEFPPGEYKIEAGPDRNATHNWGGDAEHFGIKGLGDKPKDVQFVVEQQSANYGGRWIKDHGGEGLMLKNFAIQMSRDQYTSADMWLRKNDLMLIERVEWAGLIPADDHGNNALLSAEITDRSGVGEINRLYIREGSMMPDYPDGMAGLRMSLGHKGTLYLTDMWLESIGSSAFRFSKVPGRIGVEGGYFKNNANTNLRGSAGTHPDGPSYIRGATVIVDTGDVTDYQPDDQPMTPTQVLRVDSSGQGYSGMIIEDLDVYFRNPPPSSEVIVRPSFGEHGAFTLRDSHIHNETSRPTAVIHDVSNPSDETARFENVHVTGSGGGVIKANPGTDAEIVDSCLDSSVSIQNFDRTDNVDRNGCTPPSAPTDPPHDH